MDKKNIEKSCDMDCKSNAYEQKTDHSQYIETLSAKKIDNTEDRGAYCDKETEERSATCKIKTVLKSENFDLNNETTGVVREINEENITEVDDVNTQKLDYVEILKTKRCALFFKRLFDIVASSVGLTILFPLFIIVALVIKLTSKGSIFFRQKRVGKNGKPFKIIKFRTMIVNAEKYGTVTMNKDNRITGIGKILRKTKIDELPQLFNVFAGTMSFVGPRPKTYEYYEYYDKNVFLIKPGITGYSSIAYSNEAEVLAKQDDPIRYYINTIIPTKCKIDLDYIIKMNIFYDIKTIFLTFFSVIKK